MTASLADEGNSTYCQSSVAHTLYTYKPMEINIERSLNTDVQARLELELFVHENDAL